MTNRINISPLCLVILGLALSFVTGAAFADKPDRTDRGKYHAAQEYRHQNTQNQRYRNAHKREHTTNYRFHNKDRHAVSQYYRDEKRHSKCPLGLAKKNKRCQPPGQHKKWHKGKPIAKHIRYYNLPRGLHSRLSTLQNNYRYIRIDDDILLVDRVTNVVIDAIENILH